MSDEPHVVQVRQVTAGMLMQDPTLCATSPVRCTRCNAAPIDWAMFEGAWMVIDGEPLCPACIAARQERPPVFSNQTMEVQGE